MLAAYDLFEYTHQFEDDSDIDTTVGYDETNPAQPIAVQSGNLSGVAFVPASAISGDDTPSLYAAAKSLGDDFSDVDTFLRLASTDNPVNENGGAIFEYKYVEDSSGVRLLAVADGVVHANDLNALGQRWQDTGELLWGDGNFILDSVVNQLDLNEIGLNWQNGA